MSNSSEPPGANASNISAVSHAGNGRFVDDNSLGPQAGLSFNRLICTVQDVAKSITLVDAPKLEAVTPEVMEALVGHLNKEHRLDVWAFGDSPLDLKMLSRADKAIVVVREEATRSQSRCPGKV
ncbi:hypothetical protein BDV34DRAFT_233386 [Aspergillus parasiticus]|uniref:Uncharacterized protein n=1 Tax=Aspergillus parasiticus TaxID=5067 RepID=A0A5N6D1P6_ASPPA|nr:hypothetical protein BDV34DRAFT_233386 [Aspergillus parasiticus]